VGLVPEASLEEGRKVWMTRCHSCHEGGSGAQGPVLRETIFKLIADAGRTEAMRYIVESIQLPEKVVRGTHPIDMGIGWVSDADTASVTRYVLEVVAPSGEPTTSLGKSK